MDRTTPPVSAAATMRCPDDGGALVEETVGVLGCRTCRGHALIDEAFARRHPGARELLAPEDDAASGAFARRRPCPSCARTMTPLKIGPLAAWVERCDACGIVWVERLDERVMEALVKRLARERAVASMPASERQQAASELASEVADHRRTLSAIEELRLWLISLIGW
jgi:hypothetical protein